MARIWLTANEQFVIQFAHRAARDSGCTSSVPKARHRGWLFGCKTLVFSTTDPGNASRNLSLHFFFAAFHPICLKPNIIF